MKIAMTVLALLCAALAGLNLWLLTQPYGGPLNAVAGAVCIFSAVFNGATALRS